MPCPSLEYDTASSCRTLSCLSLRQPEAPQSTKQVLRVLIRVDLRVDDGDHAVSFLKEVGEVQTTFQGRDSVLDLGRSGDKEKLKPVTPRAQPHTRNPTF